MTCLQLWFVPETPLRQALRKASLDKNTNVEYSSVSLHNKDTHKHVTGAGAVKCADILPSYLGFLHCSPEVESN